MSAPVLQMAYATPEEFLAAFDAEIKKGGLLVRGAALGNPQAMSECQVAVKVPDRAEVLVPARVAAVVPNLGVAVMFEGSPAALQALAERIRSGTPEEASAESAGGEAAPEPGAEVEAEPAPPGMLSDRLKAMTVAQKMAVALSGSREERFALLRDQTKILHVYVLKNPRIGVDEVAHAAKQPTTSPDALKVIAENREWNSNATVVIALVRNPKTPLPLALRMLDKLPMTEIRALAKGGAREQIVHAARRKVNG
ncbi:MAG TPA: hypothetical protein VGK67_00450 [Myxococcales bacterium]|jgi:hypothetical protein